MILIGTSGWSYDDWVGPVYPDQLPKRQWLPYIAERLDTLEVNVTYYRIPSERIVAGWADRTPDGFLFSVKAHRSITHEREDVDFNSFRAGLGPLIERDKLACVLAQFPYSFGANLENRDYLRKLREGFGDLALVVEFRNRAWINEGTFELLRELGLGFCAVDEPQYDSLMPPIARATSSLGYVRFHGRNYEKWWQHDQAWERYDYTYSREELIEWVPKLRGLEAETEITLVYMNNHYRGQSLDAAAKLADLLQSDGGSPGQKARKPPMV